MVSHSKTTSEPTHCLEPRREEMPKVSQRIPRSRPTPRRRSTSKPPRPPTGRDTPLQARVPTKSKVRSPSVSPVSMRTPTPLLAEEAEVAEVEEVDTRVDKEEEEEEEEARLTLSKRLRKTSQLYEQYEHPSYITKRGK